MPTTDDQLDLPREGFVRLSRFLGPGRPIPCRTFNVVRRGSRRALPPTGAPWTAHCGLAC
jgi:hypothetical protein